ncbi:unnamed protein product [Cuscuta campestris]|uniref:Pentatricopeptide repeat-containing protein-mitochondrial domain-containing protein n=1 Tax=Cuscuta campestris TaxID=132261 RepID=A0A484N6E1_9ASTE|nr:unnamed protein product [Cuscuta campestris]
MLQLLLHNLQSNKQRIKRVHFIVPQFTPYLPHYSLFSSVPVHPSRRSSPSAIKPTNIHPIPINFRGIAKDVIPDCSYLFDCSSGETLANSSLKYFIFRLSCISPETVRRFWRVHPLKPQDVLEILLGFQCVCNNIWLEAEKIDSLWGIFRRASQQKKKFSKALLICETMLAKNFTLPLEASVLLIQWLCRNGNIGKAVFLKDSFSREQPSALLYVHRALIHGLCQSGAVGKASSLYKELHLHGLSHDKEVHNSLAQGYAKAKNFKKIGEVLGVMTRKNMDLTAASYRNLLSLMFAESKLCLALSLKKLVISQNNLPPTLIYNILIFRMFSADKVSFLNTILHEIQSKGLPLEEVSNNFLIQGFSQCKDVTSSLQYLKDMMQKGLRPNNRSLREVIKCLCCNGELEKALNLSKEMELRGWKLGSVIQNALVEGLLAHGKLSEAVQLMDHVELRDLIPGNINYDVLIKRFCQHGEVDKAVDLLNIMLKKGNNSPPDSSSYDYIIQSFCCHDLLDQALDFHAEMLCRSHTANKNTWSALVQCLCRGRRVAEAETLLDTMVHMGETPTREMYSAVINGYRFENNSIKASQVLHRMQQDGYEPDFNTHWALICNLSSSSGKNKSEGFLSRFLSDVGFSRNNPNAKKG